MMPSPSLLNVGGSAHDRKYEPSSSEDLVVFIHFFPKGPVSSWKSPQSKGRVRCFLLPIQRIVDDLTMDGPQIISIKLINNYHF